MTDLEWIELAARRASDKFSPYHGTLAKQILDAFASEVCKIVKEQRKENNG